MMLGVMKYSLTDRGQARPFILAGLGPDRTSTVIDVTPNPGYGWPPDGTSFETRRFVDESNWGIASTLRFGIDFHFMEPALFSLELGWTEISNGRFQATAPGQDSGLSSVTGSIGAINILGRWSWRF
jgi:hypothetical protein